MDRTTARSPSPRRRGGWRGRGRKSGKNESKRAGASSPPVSLAPPRSTPPLPGAIDLYKLLRKSVVRSPQQCSRRIAIADSKQLYKPGLGLRQLERGVLAALMAVEPTRDACLEHVKALLAATLADPRGRRHELDCHAGDALPLPLDAIADEICELATLLRAGCAASGVTLLAVRTRLIYPAEFNELVDEYGTKAAALSHVTLALLRDVVDAVAARVQGECQHSGGEDAPARTMSSSDLRPPTSDLSPPTSLPHFITLDKHGGRNRYAAILQHHFPECWIETLAEGRAASRYRWNHREAPIEATFRVGGEAMLPTALASMTAKYHRELAMRAFNDYWTSRLPGLKPTAGYPNDAKRFRQEIEPLQRELQIDDRMIWRSR